MAIQVFPQKLQNLWEEWNLRVAVLFSLSFQIILIFFASERKRTGNMLMRAVIWSSYLLADWFAAVAVGLISSNQGDKCANGAVDNDLTAFWAPFLLLHLGGPDTITAFSLEDNELWLRHMIGVVVQVLAVLYVFIQSLPNRFWLPTALMLFAGTVKYAERTRALYLACLGNLKESLLKSIPVPDPKDYDEYMKEYFPNQAAGHHDHDHDQSPAEEATTNTGHSSSSNNIVEKGRKDLEEYEIIERAYRLYRTFRGLIVDGVINTHERIQSRKFFKGLNNEGDAFKIVEVELNFLYDALYTKMAALHYGFFWYVLRFICTTLLVAAFLLFAASDHNKSKIHRLDIAITYVLLVGAVILDLVSLVKLIFSGWTVALLLSHPNNKASSICPSRIRPLLKVLKVKSGPLAIISRMVLFRKRWSGCLYQRSMINYCLQKRYELVEKTAERFQLKDILDVFRYRTEQKVDAGLREFIFNEVKAQATISSNAEQPTSDLSFSAKGEYVPFSYGCPSFIQQTLSEIYSYDQSVLIWHIATDICFYGVPHDINSSSTSTRSTDQNRTRCKQLSDYLVYLLIMQPEILSHVDQGLAHSRFYITNETARKFLDRSSHEDGLELTVSDACERLLGADPETIEMGEVSVSLLSPGVRLAKCLENMLDENWERTWEMMSKAWLGMLLFGSDGCTGPVCAQRLNQGGEFIIFVWLILANFGFGMSGISHVQYF